MIVSGRLLFQPPGSRRRRCVAVVAVVDDVGAGGYCVPQIHTETQLPVVEARIGSHAYIAEGEEEDSAGRPVEMAADKDCHVL